MPHAQFATKAMARKYQAMLHRLTGELRDLIRVEECNGTTLPDRLYTVDVDGLLLTTSQIERCRDLQAELNMARLPALERKAEAFRNMDTKALELYWNRSRSQPPDVRRLARLILRARRGFVPASLTAPIACRACSMVEDLCTCGGTRFSQPKDR